MSDFHLKKQLVQLDIADCAFLQTHFFAKPKENWIVGSKWIPAIYWCKFVRTRNRCTEHDLVLGSTDKKIYNTGKPSFIELNTGESSSE